MKIRISDLMDHAEAMPVELRLRGDESAGRIAERTLEKLHGAAPRRVRRKWSKTCLIAAVVAGVLCATAAAAVVFRWEGFAYTGNLSEADKAALMAEVEYGTATATVDEDGTIHYYDAGGREVLALTAEEAENLKQERHETVLASTDLVDLSTMDMVPTSVTEVAADGSIEDFVLGNGSMVLLHPEGEKGYTLKKGDTVTISLKTEDACVVSFGAFLDGVFQSSENEKARNHRYAFTAEADGVYCFLILYSSVAASFFTGGTITIG